MARISLSTNSKFRRFKRRLGMPEYAARGILEMLWESAHHNGPEFKSAADIEATIEWDGEPGKAFNALVDDPDGAFLDRRDDGVFVVHDYLEHAPHWVHERLRKQKSRLAKREQSQDITGNVPDMSRTSADNPHPAKPRQAKPSIIKDISCSEVPTSGTSKPAFVPTPKKPFTTDRGPYTIEENLVYAWMPVRDCRDPRGWPFTHAHGAALVERFTAEGEESAVVEDEIAVQLRKMSGWLTDNPRRQKTPRGMPGFVASWIERHFNQRGPRP